MASSSSLQIPAGLQRHASERGKQRRRCKTTYTNVQAAKPITVQDILRHSAGLAYAEITTNEPVKAAYIEAKFSQPGVHEFDSRDMTPDEEVSRMAKIPLIHQP